MHVQTILIVRTAFFPPFDLRIAVEQWPATRIVGDVGGPRARPPQGQVRSDDIFWVRHDDRTHRASVPVKSVQPRRSRSTACARLYGRGCSCGPYCTGARTSGGRRLWPGCDSAGNTPAAFGPPSPPDAPAATPVPVVAPSPGQGHPPATPHTGHRRADAAPAPRPARRSATDASPHAPAACRAPSHSFRVRGSPGEAAACPTRLTPYATRRRSLSMPGTSANAANTPFRARSALAHMSWGHKWSHFPCPLVFSAYPARISM